MKLHMCVVACERFACVCVRVWWLLDTTQFSHRWRLQAVTMKNDLYPLSGRWTECWSCVCVCVAVSYILATSNVDTRVHVNFRVPSYGHSMRSTDHKATKGSFPAIKHTCKTFALCFLCSRVYSSLCVFVVIHFTQLNLIGPVDRTPGWIKMHITLHKKDI